MSAAKQKLDRIAIVNPDKCKPKKCMQECKRNCPVVRQGKNCIQVDKSATIAKLSEILCIGCGLCVKKCPFGAINIVNLPTNLEKETTHRYGPNSFKLHRLPVPRAGQVLGLVGINGIGKSTALKVLSGNLKPNLGRFDDPPDWNEIVRHWRGSELQNFFQKLLEENIRALTKPQYVDAIPKKIKGTVEKLIKAKVGRDNYDEIVKQLDLVHLQENEIATLSGGELQRFAIAATCVQVADIYMLDEPSSYLDVRQRLSAARVIRDLCDNEKFVVVVEHDLSVLDYLSDFVCCLYGLPGAYGVVTMPFSVREGINIFLGGFVPTENLRFRETELTFKVAENVNDEAIERNMHYTYPKMEKKMGRFTLTVEAGEFTNSEIVVMLGENGTGKTTFIRMLAGLLEPDSFPGADPDDLPQIPKLNVSYKPQKISAKFEGTVQQLLDSKIRRKLLDRQFLTDVVRPLKVEELYDQRVSHLSGGELQRVAIALALGKPADVYLIDEPSAYLDSEQRVIAAKAIKRYIIHSKKTAFIVEHDFIMSTYLADRVILYEGNPGREAVANTPTTLLTGMNKFLAALEITFRRDPTNYRPRINKHHSVKDRAQKKAGTYFYMDEDDNTPDEEPEEDSKKKKKEKPAAKEKKEKPVKEKKEKHGKK